MVILNFRVTIFEFYKKKFNNNITFNIINIYSKYNKYAKKCNTS